jgi:predicted dehydrogenase
MTTDGLMDRRGFLGRAAAATASATIALAPGVPWALAGRATGEVRGRRVKVALVGTGIRGTTMWGRDLRAHDSDLAELVALSDTNPLRLAYARGFVGGDLPTFVDCDAMLDAAKPDVLVVATPDATHDGYVKKALERGLNVVTEKPMTTDETKCRALLAAEKKAGKPIVVGFNYRFSPIMERVKATLLSGAIGDVLSVDLRWYLDVRHGADYFRRWHGRRANSGSLWVHKATHHFDLVNWWLEDEPQRVVARHDLKVYGKNGPFRAEKCRGCPHAARCRFAFDAAADPQLKALYLDCESADGYLRDACLFREEIDIPDTMGAVVSYGKGALLTYSLNAAMPYEGFSLGINGTAGRIDVRRFDRQPWDRPQGAEIRVTKSFGGSESLDLRITSADHWGGDPKLRRALFAPDAPDPLRQRANSRAGAMSILTGVAALRSADRDGDPVAVADLL